MNEILPRGMFGIFAILVLISRIDIATGRNITESVGYTKHVVSDHKAPKALRGSRLLSGSTITTPNCDMPRIADYPAELQLFYTYSVEINNELLLYDMERGIDNAVAIELDMCDFMGRPVYKIRTSTTHSFSTSGSCDPMSSENTCVVVNGETAVLLDEVSDVNFVRNRVYMGISHGLGDIDFLNGFTNSVVSATFIAEGHATLVEDRESMEDNDVSYPSGITTTVAVAAASVTIVVASIFCYGFMRRPNSRDPMVRHRHRSRRKPSPRAIVNGSQIGVPMRRHFVRLEDLSSSPSSFVTTSITPRSFSDVYNEIEDQDFSQDYSEEEYYTEVNCNPAINWSVSDITSDSASFRSGVSRTPSMLERIEEEIEDEDIDDDTGDDDNENTDSNDQGVDTIEQDDDEKSCNFSYSEDSTIITKALSKAGVVSENDSDDDATDGEEKSLEQKVSNFDNTCEQQDCVLDISDLDPCFTILPDNTEEVFRELEDLSSEGTQDSLVVSMLLEVNLSMDDADSFKTAMSDTTIISLPTDGCHTIPIECIHSDQSESSTLKSLISVLVEDHSALDSSILSTTPQETEESASFHTPLKETPADVEEVVASPPRQDDIIHIVSDSEDDSFDSEVESEVDANGEILDETYESKMEATSVSKALQDISNTDTDIDQHTIEIAAIDSTENDEEENVFSFTKDDDLDTNICSVDSIDEWVNELMSQEPIATTVSSVNEI